MPFKASLGVLLVLLPGLSFALGRNSAEQKTQVDGIRLGRPDIIIAGVAHPSLPEFMELFAAGAKLLDSEAAKLGAQPTTDQWLAAESLGFSRDSSLVIRAFMEATEDQQIDAANADIGVTLVSRGDRFDVEGHVDLTKLAESGHFSRSFAKSLIYSGSLTDADMVRVFQLLSRSMKVNLAIQQAFLAMNDTPRVNYSATLTLDFVGVDVEVRVAGFWDNFWAGVRETVNCFPNALDHFVGGSDQVSGSVTCGATGCDFTMSGTASGSDAADLFAGLRDCLMQ